VPATVSILRGLKERYESHHGIRITDGAIVLAAKVSSFVREMVVMEKYPDGCMRGLGGWLMGG
jgi:hypothetical protein